MKFIAPIALFAAGVFAVPNAAAAELCDRDISPIDTIMETVLAGIQTLDQACLDYSSGPGQDLVDASDKMLTIIRTATNNAAGLLPLTMDEAMAFQPLSDKLNAAGNKLLEDISAKVTLFALNCICEVTLNWVSQIAGNVNTLMTTISTKFPAGGAGGRGGDEMAHFGEVFAQMQSSLMQCSGRACTPGSGIVGGFTPTQAAVPGAVAPTGTIPPHGNKEEEGSPSSKPVTAAGAAMATFSGAGAAAAFAAAALFL